MVTSFSAAMFAAVRLISPSVVAIRTPPPADSWVPVMVSHGQTLIRFPRDSVPRRQQWIRHDLSIPEPTLPVRQIA